MIWTKLKNNWPLLLLLILQSGIIFYDFDSIPFSHDELSAIQRCKFNHLSDLIENGIMPDGHPAGVQFLLYFLIQFFGIHEWILKLPFAILGIGSLILLYSIGNRIFNKYAAFTTSILFISLGYYLSQLLLARPYSPGLFFSLGVFWTCIRIKDRPLRISSYLFLGLFSIGAMYSHYFSFLQCLVILTSFYIFYSHRIHKRNYLISCFASLLLFAPHFMITFHQLGMGGLEWLGKPTLDFFPEFFYTYFNSSLILSIVAACLFILSFFVKQKSKKIKPLILVIFLLPCFVIYTYSIFRAPVLQPPALFFSTPFMILLIGNGVNFFRYYFKLIIIIVVSLFSLYLLIIKNQFYKLRDYQPIEKFVLRSQKIMNGVLKNKAGGCKTGALKIE